MALIRPPSVSAIFLRDAWVLGLLAAITCGLASCSTQTPGRTPTSPTSPTSPASPGKQLAWMMTRAALSQMVTDPTVRTRLEASQVYEILQPGQQPLATVGATPVVTFSAVSDLEQAVTGNHLPATTDAVLYDPEAWAYTPAAEQRDPAQAARQALDIAHAHGLKLIVTPGLNLTSVQPTSGPRWQQFLHLGLAGAIAKVSDIIELQAQSLERQTGTYAEFVRAAAAQARAANPHVIVLAGLSTNPPGAPVSAQQLTAAIRATSGIVAGYWLNIPGRGARCPTCNAPRPDIGRQTLREIS
jgi:hypothetical protein